MIGLGPFHTVSLKEARDRAKAARLQLQDGIDPLTAKREKRRAVVKAHTFKDAALQYITDRGAEWSTIHRNQWQQTLRDYAFPHIGNLPVASIDTEQVMKVLKPIWTAKQTAQRLRGRIEAVLGWATVMKLRSGDNPAAWGNHLENLLPKPSKVHPVKHHAAMPYEDLPAFMEELRAVEGVPARALEIAILTALRTGEVIGAEWPEIDLQKREWLIPAERMKMSKDHRIPLSPRAVEILSELPRVEGNPHVFVGERVGQPIGNRALFLLLRSLRPGVTVHGFRSTFRDWAAERTNVDHAVAEAALAHQVGSAVERAYKRTDLFNKRRALMEAWESSA